MSSSASPFARLPALVEAATREQAAAEEDTAAAASGDEEEVYVLLDFSAAELPPGTEIRGDLAIEVRTAYQTQRKPLWTSTWRLLRARHT